MRMGKLFSVLVFGMLLVTSFSIHSRGTVTVTESEMESDLSTGFSLTGLYRLNGVYYVPANDSESFAYVLNLSENNSHIKIRLSWGEYKPYLYRSLPVDLMSGTEIIGVFPAQETWAMDRMIATNGTRIYCDGNTLFNSTNTSGIHLENMYITDFEHIFTCGEPMPSFEYGITQSLFRNIFGYDGTDYAFEFYNFQRIRMDLVVMSTCGGFAHCISSTDSFQPGNSVWTDCLISYTKNDDPFWFEARDTNLNYMTFIRLQQAPQLYSGVAPLEHCILLDGNGAAKVVGFTFVDCNLEGDFDYYVYMDNTVQSTFNLIGTLNQANNWSVLLDSTCEENVIHFTKEGNISCDNYRNFVTGYLTDVDEVGNKDLTGFLWREDETEKVSAYFGSTNDNNKIEYDLESVDYNRRTLTADGYCGRSQDVMSYSSSAVNGEFRWHDGSSNNASGWYVYDGSNWDSITSIATSTGTIPYISPIDPGTMWLNTTTNDLCIWNGTAWVYK